MNPETIKKYQLNKRTWVEKGFHGVLNFFFIVGEQPLKTLQDWFGDCYEAVAFAFEKNYGYWYWCHEDMDRLKHKFVEKVNANPQHLQDLLAEWHDRVKALENSEIFEVSTPELTDIVRLADDYNRVVKKT